MSEKELPAGWVWAELGDVVDVLDSQRVPVSAKIRATRMGEVPYYGAAGQVGWIDQAIFDEDLILLGEDGVQFFDATKEKAYRITGKAWVNNHAHVLRAKCVVDWRYLCGYLNSFNYEGYANGTTRLKLTKSAMLSIPVAVPPLAEQHRIVEAFEDHLSRLDAASEVAKRVRKRIVNLKKSVLLDLVPEKVPGSWTASTVEQAGTVELGRARHPDWHHGPEMHPYLRVANVFEDRIDTSDVMEMDFSGIFEKYRLRPGDVLLNEGQSPHLVGRPALYRGTPPNVAFTNSLLRFKANSNVMPEWALMVFRRHLHARRFMREVRITTNIAHLSSKRLKTVEFPIPPMNVQKELVGRWDELLSGVDAMDRETVRTLARAKNLRRAILTRAFTGALVPQDPTDEPATALLARIQAERAAQPKAKRARRTPAAPRKAKAPAAARTEPAPAPTPAPTHAVQQEFEL
ncbi:MULTISPECIES: restriction endonuclease subunit S [unclassified Streptomyces]|uniref:restriction endonuclease subunit S n=1 Tax=unclassified Streptomyces TaxID=2593676 RepID=UPI002250C5E8|nr:MULTISPECIES: restriction endonuclease subunit S [unclassified Streptomyces]MCX4396548.1 restriction endonuclease subunit S [Streptomyces sp. NBC_01767]MCX5100805.1 restriction endonuclease subunit S [Streptomyces sp. NBC_00439]